MRKLSVGTFMSLDGVMQASGGPREDDSGGFELGGWSVGYFDERLGAAMDEWLSGSFDLLLGRRTYDIFAAHCPRAAEDGDELGIRFDKATKYVASRGQPDLAWANSVLIEGDVAEGVAKLKLEDGPDLQVQGGGDLVQTLLRHGLVDQLHLRVFPLVIGSGKRLFAHGAAPTGLRLVDSTVTSTGVFVDTYEPAGEIVTGSFELD
jgi:dihydrofolate reductase